MRIFPFRNITAVWQPILDRVRAVFRWSPGLLPGVCFFATCVCADDRRIWLQQAVETNLSDRWKAGLQSGFYFANKDPQFYNYYGEAFLVRHTAKRLDLGLGYREQFEKKADGPWLEENRPFASLTFSWTWWNWAFSDRNQMEWRSLEARDDQVRYRNKLMAESPARWGSWGLHPYLADEMFFDDETREFLRNRIHAGLKARPRPWLGSDLFLIWESDDTGINARDAVYIAGLKLTARL